MTLAELRLAGYQFVVIHGDGVKVLVERRAAHVHSVTMERRSDAMIAAMEMAEVDYVRRRLDGEFG